MGARSGRLGTVVGRSLDDGLVGVSSPLFERALSAVLDFTSPRAWAFALLGIDEYLKRLSGDRGVQQIREELASRLMAQFEAARSTNWLWFEDILAYDNATLPRALLLAGAGMGKQEYVAVALTSLKWLMEIQRPEGAHFVAIGSMASIRKARSARASISSQWRPMRRSRRASTLTASLGMRTGARRRRWRLTGSSARTICISR